MRWLAFFLSLAPVACFAGDITVHHAWAPPSVTKNGVGFLSLESSEDDALVSVTSECCKQVELHRMQQQGEIMRMRKVHKLILPAHETVAMRPGGYHLMLFGLRQDFAVGDTVPVTLHFAHAPAQTATLHVEPKAPEAHDHSAMGH